MVQLIDMTDPTSTPPDPHHRSGEAQGKREPSAANMRSEFLGALGKGFVLGATALVLVLPPVLYLKRHQSEVVQAASTVQAGPAQRAAASPSPDAPGQTEPPPAKARTPQTQQPQQAAPREIPRETRAIRVARHADLQGERASQDVKRIADWIADSADAGKSSFIIVDKKDAKVYLFDSGARLQAATPALLGSARGDDTVPGIGDKPLAQVKPEEKTTPAGRFIAEVGESSSRGEDVVWVDYDAAVSMHRVIKAPERLRSLASPQPDDNRMSFGCINLPDAFYEKALRPAVDRGAIIYVLPETRPLEQTFAAFYDVGARQRIAQR
jgi:hypothetical protein